MSNKASVQGKFLLEKFPGKGGWIYARLPGLKTQKHTPFGWRQVRGRIDDHEISAYKLMPYGNGELFLPVNAAVRRKMGKSVGDVVEVELYDDHSTLEIPTELQECLRAEGMEYWLSFTALPEQQQDRYVRYIYDVKDLDKRAERILKMREELGNMPKP